jgi:hypothetical protein
MRFVALVRCDVDTCDALVEPHVGRCGNHRAKHGALTTGTPGMVKPPTKPPERKPEPAPCCGPIGAGCPHGKVIDRNRGKRCARCQTELVERSRKAA